LEAFVERTTRLTLEHWQRVICRRLEQLQHQKGQRLLIHAPPQFGKSIIISQRFPAWIIGGDPTSRIRLACYNQTHAERFSFVNREIMTMPLYRAMFPDVQLPKMYRIEEWSTVQRRSLRDGQPSFVALGLGSGFTGLGADYLIIDDPYKNREEAHSPIINENIWLWYTDVAIPRLNPEANVIVMFHRWKEDDLAGRLLKEGGWEELRFAAICDGEDDPAQRAVGEPLSARFPLEYLYEVERKQTEFVFAGMYQGRPRSRAGNLFKAQWIKKVKAAPVDALRVRYWDKAGSEDARADRTAGGLMSKTKDGKYYIENIAYGRWSPHERNARIMHAAEMDARLRPIIFIEEEPGAGTETTATLIRLLAGYRVKRDRVQKNKVDRAEPLADQMEAGNVYIVEGEWNKEFIDELLSFPYGKHDDLVDCVTGAFNKLTRIY
jgi:predicted phage terminase large subunit-like protein